MRTGALSVIAVALLLPAAAARAEFTPATLLSGTAQLQFDRASSPAFSRNGEYVVFRGSLAGVPGIYRRDLESGEVLPVAVEDSADTAISAPDASAPSISEEGRYVVFTSAAVLDPQDEGPKGEDAAGCPQVYVRDMDLAPTAPGAYTLVSAVNGSSESLTYEKHCAAGSSGGSLVLAGAQAAPAAAISANGQQVVFTVLSASDLTGPCTGTPAVCPTEPSQVAVRDLEAKTTTVVSVTPSGEPTPGGGAFPSKVSIESGVDSGAEADSSAAISAEGDAVAWQGTNVPAQVPSASEEITAGMKTLGVNGGAAQEVEPLWRLIAGGAGTVTKRLLPGASAGLNFYFSDSHEGSDRAIEGGALAPVQQAFIAPALSANGQTAAVISNAPTHANEASYEASGLRPRLPPADAYVIQVDDAPATPSQVTPLTETPDYAALNAIDGEVSDVAISPDGTRVAFNTRRVSFALEPPTLISPPVQEGADAYTYVANLELGTLQRVTNTYEGAPPDGEPGQISFAGDELSLAFASDAANLFYGDGTPGESQVYLTRELPPPSQIASQSESQLPLQALPTPEWTLSATAAAQADGSVLIDARVPGAGRLAARARAQLPVKTTRRAKRAKNGRAEAGKSRADKVVQVPARTVGQAAALADGASELRLRLRVSPAYRALVASSDGLYCVLDVSFAAPGHATLEREIPVTLHLLAPKKSSRAKAAHGKPGAAR